MLAISTAAAGQSQNPSTSRMRSANGIVTAISSTSLTLEREGNELKLLVNGATRVIKKPAGTATGTNDLVYRQPPKKISDVIRPGDRATVKYRFSNHQPTAIEVRLNTN